MTGKIVEFSARLTPAASMRVGSPDDLAFGQGAKMALTIIGMSPEERASFCAERAREPEGALLVWFAMLSPEERSELLRTAKQVLETRKE